MADRDPGKVSAKVDWREVVRLVLTSREMDRLEEQELVPAKKVLYQFSARGHDMAQVLLGLCLKEGDAACGYYRSRPLLLSLGVSLADALGSGMGLAGGYSDGRDIGVVFNYPNPGGVHALPMCGGVGAQYTPAAGWAQAIKYKAETLGEGPDDAIAVVLGGDASCATGGFWSALTIATTQQLPLLIYIEDNGYGISVTSDYQTPGRDIAANLASFNGLKVINGDGTDPAEVARLIGEAVALVRTKRAPVLLRVTVPRLEGHSAQDTQTYKSDEEIAAEWARDPLPKLKAFVAELQLGDDQWSALEREAEWQVEAARAEAEGRGVSAPEDVTRHVFFDGEMSRVGGGAGLSLDGTVREPASEGQRINMVTAIRRTLEQELEANPRMLVFGEDVGPKGGVHAVTLGMQDRFGVARVFDTSLNEEGIVGRAVGMAIAGLLPVPEIQFRKYAEPASEQIHDCGTMRWRTA
ncbi:MAG: thiamine pyrophosphate-dependent enzyme, partial [Sphingomicrobium sp.]